MFHENCAGQTWPPLLPRGQGQGLGVAPSDWQLCKNLCEKMAGRGGIHDFRLPSYKLQPAENSSSRISRDLNAMKSSNNSSSILKRTWMQGKIAIAEFKETCTQWRTAAQNKQRLEHN